MSTNRRGPLFSTDAVRCSADAGCSTDEQDLTAQRRLLRGLGVAEDRIYLDHRLTGSTRAPPGLDPALAAVRAGDTLVVPKLDRLARSSPDARDIGDSLAARGIRLSLGGQIYDPADPMRKMFFNILATFAEFEVDLLRMCTREDMARRRASYGASNPSCRSSSRPNSCGCTAPVTTPSRTSPRCSLRVAATVYRVLERARDARIGTPEGGAT